MAGLIDPGKKCINSQQTTLMKGHNSQIYKILRRLVELIREAAKKVPPLVARLYYEGGRGGKGWGIKEKKFC